MKVRYSPRAKRRATAIKKWWLANRPAVSDLFERELAQATEQLEATPTLRTIYGTIGGKVVMRLLLPKSEQHLYYSVDKEAGVIGLITIWGARRGRPPKL